MSTNSPSALPHYANVLEMIGNTPMVEATRLDTGPCRLFLKLERLFKNNDFENKKGL